MSISKTKRRKEGGNTVYEAKEKNARIQRKTAEGRL